MESGLPIRLKTVFPVLSTLFMEPFLRVLRVSLRIRLVLVAKHWRTVWLHRRLLDHNSTSEKLLVSPTGQMIIVSG